MANYSSTVKEILKKVVTDILPTDTSVTRNPVNAVGITHIDKYVPLKFTHPTQTEKTTTTIKYGFAIDDTFELFWPHHVKDYNVPRVGEILDRVLVSSVLEASPTPLETYAIALNRGESLPPFVSSSAIDLNSLVVKETGMPVKTIRFDRFLSDCGYKGPYPDLHSFLDVQNFINNEAVNKKASLRAVLQTVLASYMIPNAIGETDPNSRNIILADTDGDGIYDTVFRIDAESNTYLRDMYNERSGNKIVPKGIYSANESQDEFLMNIKNGQRGIGHEKIDWELYVGLLDITDYFISRNVLDDAISNRGYRRNQHRYNENAPAEDPSYFVSKRRLSMNTYGEFSEATIERAHKYTINVRNAIGGLVRPRYLNDGIINDPKAPQLESALYDAKGRIFDSKGNILKPEDFQPGL